MVKEIIRSARDPVKNRVIPVTIVDKYMNKIKGMAEQVKTVMEEEQAEREIASLENKPIAWKMNSRQGRSRNALSKWAKPVTPYLC
jgi:hypothetical protein